MSCVDQYLKDDLAIELIDQLVCLERELLELESEALPGREASLARTVRVLQDAREQAESLGFRNLDHLLQAMTNGVLELQRNESSCQAGRIDSLLSAVDTLTTLLENVDQSDEFDIRGQLSVLRDCSGPDNSESLVFSQLCRLLSETVDLRCRSYIFVLSGSHTPWLSASSSGVSGIQTDANG